MRARALIIETFFRKAGIPLVHVVWLVLYAFFWWLFLPNVETLGRFVFIWGGFFLALTLSAGIIGDDISSGRICVLLTKPFWSGQLYLYRLLGLSLQGGMHLALAGGLLYALEIVARNHYPHGLGWWLLSSWLLFNTCAALSASLSVIISRAFNSLLLLVVVTTGYLVVVTLMGHMGQQAGEGTFLGFIRYAGPPFELLYKLAGGERGQFSLIFGRWSVARSLACVAHSLLLTGVYSVIGMILLSAREFSRARD